MRSRPMLRRTLLLAGAFLACAMTFPWLSAFAADPFAEGVRPTPWQKPEDEQKAFRLLPGFEIQLFAAEPDILKPMNMAFDAKGRMWVSVTQEYPYPAPTNRLGRDAIKVLEDTNGDGRADRVTTFADGLNIPIGLYPFFSRNADGRSTWKVIAWSIPNIWLMEDADGDGKADRRENLYGPFDYSRDTHGNQASFRRGFDGWLYCTHGYNNDSHVKGRDGHEVHLNSGNTYRLRLDGSRIEQHTFGQVNPFGLAFDELGNLYSSDCHSAPIYQLLRGGYYPSFGKPDDGLGFAPTMMESPRGSTALDGMSYYADNLWPAEFRDNLFIGDVMSSRVFRDRAVERGATKVAQPLADLVATEDPWFRPVDTQLGPDGAFYIADFYNRIIGHYEVPLTHPGRDRTSGRIWRVVYRGEGGKARLHPVRDLTVAPVRQLVENLGHANIKIRSLASDQLVDRLGKQAISAVKRAANKPASSLQHAHALWVLHRLGALDEKTLMAGAEHPDRLVRLHVMRILTELPELSASLRQAAIAALEDQDGHVKRCAAEALSTHPAYEQIRPLLSLRQRVHPEDTHLLYVSRKALRDHLVSESNFERLAGSALSTNDVDLIRDVALAVKSGASARFLLRQLPESAGMDASAPILRHAARYAPEEDLPRLAELARRRIPAEAAGGASTREIERQLALFKSIDEGLQQRGSAVPAAVREWGTDLLKHFFATMGIQSSWAARAYEPAPTAHPWGMENRQSTDGQTRELTSSLPQGEQLTGVLRSPNFTLPPTLRFWLCGHDGFPNKPAQKLNRIRLRSAETGDILMEAFPPRNDVARRITWDLSAHQGKAGYIEVEDGDTGSAYAWLAFGNFDPELPELRPSGIPSRKSISSAMAAAEIAVRLKAREYATPLGRLVVSSAGGADAETDPELAATFARAWIALDSASAISGLSAALNEGKGSPLYRERISEVLAGRPEPAAQTAVIAGLKTLSLKSQEKLAFVMASAPFSAETLLSALETGVVSPRVLQRVGVNNRLKSSKPRDWESRVAALTKGLAPADETREKLLAQRRAAYSPHQGRSRQGREVFAKNCAACHRIGTEGAVVGPQLDGIGQRGLERLCEDILDPNRNIDRAFRSTLFTLKDGDVVSGLFRREEGELIILADGTGKEIPVPKKEITERRESEVSLMPENLAELLSPEDFNHLMFFLLEQRTPGQ